MENYGILEKADKPISSHTKYWFQKGNKFSEIINTGGWIEYKKLLAEIELEKLGEKAEQKELNRLQRENLIDDNERLRYEKTIRGLNEQLLWFNLLRNYWWLIALALAIGLFLGASGEQKLHLLENLLGIQ